MPRKKIIPERTLADRFDDMVVEAIWGSSIQIRETIARSFEAGQIAPLIKYQVSKSTIDALLIAALIDAESSLVFIGYELRAKRLIDLVEVISHTAAFKELMNIPQISHRSVDNLPKSVDNSRLPADKTVEKVVEKNGPSVDKYPMFQASPQVGPDLSPACGEVVSLSTGPVDNFDPGLQSEQSLFKDSSPDAIPADLSTQSTKPTTTAISTHI